MRRYVLFFFAYLTNYFWAFLCDAFRTFVYFVVVFDQDVDLLLKRMKWIGV